MSKIRCPKCGAETTIRTSKKDGSKFHVCVNYPDCSGKVEFDENWDDEWEEERPARRTTHDRSQQRRVPKENASLGKMKASLFRIIAGVVIGIIALIISIPIIFGHQDTSTSTLPTYTTTPIYTATPTSVSTLGQPIIVGNVARWTVLEAEDVGQVLYGSESRYPLWTEDKTTIGKFIKVTFVIENVGSEPDYMEDPNIVDSQSREFSSAEGYWEYVPEDMYCGFCELQPNMPKQFIVIYEVPMDSTGFKLKVNDFNLIYPMTALISLGF